MVLIDLEGASPRLYGQLSRRMLEVRSGVFVGVLSKRSFVEIWDAVEKSHPQAAMAVYPVKTELGIAIKTYGQHRYHVIDNDGLPLIAIRKSVGTGSRDLQ